jgi:hypothetical protein
MALSKRILMVMFLVILVMGIFAFYNFYNLSTSNSIIDQTADTDADLEIPQSILDSSNVYQTTTNQDANEKNILIDESSDDTTSDPIDSKSQSILEDISDPATDDASEAQNPISTSDQDYYSQKLDSLSSQNNALSTSLSVFYSEFSLIKEFISKDSISNIEVEYQSLINSSLISMEENSETLDSLQSQLLTLSSEHQADFVQQINLVSDIISKKNDQIRTEKSKLYQSINSNYLQNKNDLLMSEIKVDFIPSDKEEITLALTIMNVGDKEMKYKSTYFSNFTINGELVDTCRKEINRISSFDSEQITCEIDIKEEYSNLEKGKFNFLEFVLVGSVDSNQEFEETSGSNNNFLWYLDMTLEEFS